MSRGRRLPSRRSRAAQLQFQFTAVQEGPGGIGEECWPRLNRSGRPRSELLMRFGFAPIRGSNFRASAGHGPLPERSGEGGLTGHGPRVAVWVAIAPHLSPHSAWSIRSLASFIWSVATCV
jgi:hypothetical protein